MGADQVDSLATLYRHHANTVYRYLLHLSGHCAVADDLAGETFCRAVLSLDGFRGEASVRTWLLRIARNLYLRRSQREKRTRSLESLQDQGMAFASTGDGPEAALLRREHTRAVQQALLSLPESGRSILLLAADEGMTRREMAQVLGISVAAAKVRLYRARRRLVSALSSGRAGPDGGGEGQGVSAK